MARNQQPNLTILKDNNSHLNWSSASSFHSVLIAATAATIKLAARPPLLCFGSFTTIFSLRLLISPISNQTPCSWKVSGQNRIPHECLRSYFTNCYSWLLMRFQPLPSQPPPTGTIYKAIVFFLLIFYFFIYYSLDYNVSGGNQTQRNLTTTLDVVSFLSPLSLRFSLHHQ